MNDQPLVRRYPGDELAKLQCRRPYNGQPVRVWVAWFVRQAELWDDIALDDATLADTAVFGREHLRRKAKELSEQFKPNDRWPGRRHGDQAT